jgi:peptidoglycan hydrolase-like protein with peptidoglycan-binding domain
MARPTIQVGSKGQDVKDAQQALIDRGYPVGTAGVDGIFGLHTYRAVLDYQDDRSKSGGPGPEVPARWGFNYLLAVDGGHRTLDLGQVGSRPNSTRLDGATRDARSEHPSLGSRLRRLWTHC